MKHLNTLLLLIIAAGLAANFYLDHKRDIAWQIRMDTTAAAKPKDTEPSPFDKVQETPMHTSQRPPVSGTTTISFDRTAHDFGRVETGPTYSTSFPFKNTGSEDLYISAAEASCGCTVPRWSHDPIKPGATGTIFVEFDSKGRQGQQLKTVTVTTNTDPPQNVLTLKSFLYLRTQ